MPKITIEGYLLQEKLEIAIKSLVSESNWLGSEYVIPKTRYRLDMLFIKDEQKIAVEFDGDAHYRDSLKIKRDEEKDRLAKQHNIKVVRWPYWVQLTSETLHHYLKIDAEIEQNFPHGFIKTKLYPASFCEKGLIRFHLEMESIPPSVRKEVLISLANRAKKHDYDYVIPASTKDFFQNKGWLPELGI